MNKVEAVSLLPSFVDDETDPKAAVGLARGTPTSNHSQAAEMIWNRVVAATSAISSTVGGLAKSHEQEDDNSVDQDGNTKLTRVMKQCVLSILNFQNTVAKFAGEADIIFRPLSRLPIFLRGYSRPQSSVVVSFQHRTLLLLLRMLRNDPSFARTPMLVIDNTVLILPVHLSIDSLLVPRPNSLRNQTKLSRIFRDSLLWLEGRTAGDGMQKSRLLASGMTEEDDQRQRIDCER